MDKYNYEKNKLFWWWHILWISISIKNGERSKQYCEDKKKGYRKWIGLMQRIKKEHKKLIQKLKIKMKRQRKSKRIWEKIQKK